MSEEEKPIDPFKGKIRKTIKPIGCWTSYPHILVWVMEDEIDVNEHEIETYGAQWRYAHINDLKNLEEVREALEKAEKWDTLDSEFEQILSENKKLRRRVEKAQTWIKLLPRGFRQSHIITKLERILSGEEGE